MNCKQLKGDIKRAVRKRAEARGRAGRLIGRKKARCKFRFNHHLQSYFFHDELLRLLMRCRPI